MQPSLAWIKREVPLRRILIIGFTAALLALVAAPGVVGRVAEARQASLLDGLARGIPRSRAETERYDAGWFASSARHRLVFDDPAFLQAARDLFGDADLETPPALVIDSRIVHGPWPGLGGGPAIARIRSELRIEAGPHSVELPGEALTTIALDGGGETLFTSAGVIHEAPGGEGRIVWNGGQLRVSFDRRLAELDSEGELGVIAMDSPRGSLVLGPLRMSAKTRMSGHGFRTGTSELVLERFRLEEASGPDMEFTDVRMSGQVAETDETVDHGFTLASEFTGLGPLGAGTLHSDSALRGLDAAAYGRVMRATARGEDPLPGDLHRLLAGAPVLEVSRFDLDSAEGRVSATLRLWLTPATAGTGAPASPADYLRRLGGEGRVELSSGIIAAAALNDPRAGDAATTLLAMGYLQREDGGYLMRLAYGGGLLTVNGLPVPLPAGAYSR